MTKIIASFIPEEGFKHRFVWYDCDSTDKIMREAFQLSLEVFEKGFIVTTEANRHQEVYVRWHEVKKDKSGLCYWGNELITITRRRKFLTENEYKVEINWSALGSVDRQLTALFGAALVHAAKMAETLEVKGLNWEILPDDLKELLTKG